jgi:hypothetical protein
MRFPEALVAIVALVVIFGGLRLGPLLESWKQSEITITCNNLKAAAIAASQPEPKCAE